MELPRTLSRSLRFLIPAIACATTLAFARPAAAGDDVALWAGGSLTNAGKVSSNGPQLGVGGQAGAVFSIGEFWGFELGAEGAHHFQAKPGDRKLESMRVSDGWVGLRYNLDVFTYVPYIGGSVVLYGAAPRVEPGTPQRSSVGVKLSIGTDWRFDRHWSLGFRADLHAVHLAVGQFPNYSSAGLNLAYRFRL